MWINPFWEDDLYQVVDIMGADRVIFGSDWPHIEALPEPLDYLREVKDLAPEDRRKVLHDNALELLTTLARPGLTLRSASLPAGGFAICADRSGSGRRLRPDSTARAVAQAPT